MGNPKLPTELKALRGTLNTTREKQNPSADLKLAETNIIIKDDEKVSTPKTIQTRRGKQFYKLLVSNLREIHVLSRVDLHQIETMTRYLERMHEIDSRLNETPLDNKEDYLYLSNLYDRLSTRFDSLASKFYITPAARVQLKLNELNVIKTAQDIQKNNSAVSNLLNMRKVSD